MGICLQERRLSWRQQEAACHLVTWDLDTPLYFLLGELKQLFPPEGLSFPFCEMGPHREQLLSTIYCYADKARSIMTHVEWCPFWLEYFANCAS